jgi:hypothetical protein
VFDSDDDEIQFSAVNQSAFLDAVRELVGEPKPEPVPAPAVAPPPDGDARLALWRAGAQVLDALNELSAADPGAWAAADPDLRTRLRTGLADLLRRLDPHPR